MPCCGTMGLCVHVSSRPFDALGVLSMDYLRSVASAVPSCGADLGLLAELTRSTDLYPHLWNLKLAPMVSI